MTEKTNSKLNSFAYKFLAFVLISWKFILLLLLLLVIINLINIFFLKLTPQLLRVGQERAGISIFQITLLGILLTSYAFLLNVVRKRESSDYAKENTHIVLRLIGFRVVIISTASITTAVLMYFTEIAIKIAPILFSASIFIMLIKLLLVISIIGHQWLFFLMALKNLKDSHKELIKICVKASQPSMIEVFQRITDLEQMVKQVCESHAYELADYFSPQDAIEFIAERKRIPESDLYGIYYYIKLLECRNSAIIMNKRNKRDVSEIISVKFVKGKVEDTEKFFLKQFFSNEYFSKLTFTEKNFNEANFSFTMFEGCVFNSVSLGGTDCQSTNFTGSKFILDKDKNLFDESTKLENAKFDGVQFSELIYTPDTCVEIKSATFRKANFYSSNLKNLEFKLALFDGASFFNSQISKVVFWRTSLNEVNFSVARIEETNYEYALLSNAIFYDAKLKNCNFVGATLKFVEFNEATLENSKLTNAVCDNASFSRAELKDIDFVQASLNDTVFTDSELQDVNMSYAIFKNSLIVNIRITSEIDEWNKFEETEFNHTRFVSTNTEAKPTIQRSHFKNAFFSNSVLVGYTISDSKFEYSIFFCTRFSDITFVYKLTQNEKGIMEELQFKECEFNRVKFSNIQMENTIFLDCEFLTPEQVFFGVELNNVKFIGCSFPTNKSYRDFFKGTNVENMNKSERKKYVEILADQKNDFADENGGGEQPNNEAT